MGIIIQIWERWLIIGRMIGDFIGRLVLSVFYFTIFMPFGLAMRLLGDPLALRLSHRPRWIERITKDRVLDDARRLF